MRAVSSARVIYSVSGTEGSERLTVGDAVYAKTVVKAEQLERVIIVGIHVPENDDEETLVDVMWCWSLKDVENELTAEAVRNGANAARDFLLPISQSHFGQRISLSCIEMTRWCPYFPSEARHLSVISAGCESARVAGFLQHIKVDGVYREKYHPPQAPGPRASCGDVFTWVAKKAPGFVGSTNAEDLGALHAAGVPVAGGLPHIDLRPMSASIRLPLVSGDAEATAPAPAGSAQQAKDPHEPRTGSVSSPEAIPTDQASSGDVASTTEAPSLGPAATACVSKTETGPGPAFACERLIPKAKAAEAFVPTAAVAGEARRADPPPRGARAARKRARSAQVAAALEDSEDECNEDVELTSEELYGPGDLGPMEIPEVKQTSACPLKTWDADLRKVKSVPPKHFHWEIAKLVAEEAYEARGFGTNTWTVRPGMRSLEVEARSFYDGLYNELVVQVAKASTKDDSNVVCHVRCPAVFAASLIRENGELYSVKDNVNPTYRSGVYAAPMLSRTVEARMGAVDLGILLRYPFENALRFDGRLHITRIYSGNLILSSYQRMQPLTQKRLSDGTVPVASISYSEASSLLTLKMKLKFATKTTHRVGRRMCMDLDELVAE